MATQTASALDDVRSTAEEFPFRGTAGEQLAFVVRYAVLAPSSHNSQPWSFRVDGEVLELRADRTRALPIVDPDGRELVISCGAALYTLRVALRHFGCDAETDLLPDPRDPGLLTRVELVGPGRPPSYEENLLFWAIRARHTNRRPFEHRAVPREVLEDLAAAAGTEGAWLEFVASDRRYALTEMIADAERLQGSDRKFRHELAHWMRTNRTHAPDGMPGHAYGLGTVASYVAPVATRTLPWGDRRAAHDRKLAADSPVLAVLGTARDDVAAWLAAGQAVAHVLLRATQEEVAASFLNMPVEVPEFRPFVAAVVGRTDWPQLVLRLGYGSLRQQPTPRRSAADVLTVE
jgi:nitroreductase